MDPAEVLDYAFAELLAGHEATLARRLVRACQLLDDLHESQDRPERQRANQRGARSRRGSAVSARYLTNVCRR